MKATLFALFVGLLIVGCGEEPGGDSPESNQSSAETPPAKTPQVAKIDFDDKETLEEIIAEAIDNDDIPSDYTGWVKDGMWSSGQIQRLFQFKDGKLDGLCSFYNEDGTIKKRLTYKDGKRVEDQEQARKTEEEGSLLALYTLLQMNKAVQSQRFQLTEGGQLRDMELSGEEKYYELTGLITNLGGPIKSRYIDIELNLEGLAEDFEKLIEINENRLRNKALTIMGQYTYEDAQLDGFQERVRVDLKKGFSIVLKKYRNGESDLIRNIYFTQFVVQ